jgi:hypothetical protein
MEEITIKKRKYRIMQIALIVTSIILLIIMIDWFANLKYYTLIGNFGLFQDNKYANHSCVILGDASGTESYITWTACCENYSDDCFMRVYSCVNVYKPDTCQLLELNMTPGRKVLKQYKVIEKELKNYK